MSQKLDILFIKPGSQKKIYSTLANSLTALEPPILAALQAGYMRSKGYNVAILDMEMEEGSLDEIARKVDAIDPKLVAVIVYGSNPQASTQNMVGARDVIDALKRNSSNVRVILGGLHPSSLPQLTMEQEECDFVCQGEGFTTYEELLKEIDQGKGEGDEFSAKGLWYRRDGEIVSNPRADLTKDLGELPMPAWDLLPMRDYRAHNWHCFAHIHERQPYAVIYTSLGCPFTCSFCCINEIFGGPGIRYRPPADVAEEIDYLAKNFGVKNIKILDEMFALKKDHVLELCDRIAALGHDLNFWCYGRIDTVKDYMIPKMKAAGINWIGYGVEAGSKKVRDGVSKGRFTEEDIKRVVQMTRDGGINAGCNYIFGLPEDDLESMQETLDLACEINSEYANFYAAMAYPGSQLYTDAIRDGSPLPESWLGYAQFSRETFPLPTKHLSNSEVLRFRDEAFHIYFERPEYLTMIEKKFGPEAVAHIKQMCATRLERNLLQSPVPAEV